MAPTTVHELVHKGMAAEEVLRLVGEPLERTSTDHAETQRYYVREERVDEKRLLGFATVKGWRWQRSTRAEVLVQNGVVVDITYNSNVAPPK